ncbi:cytochrome P450 87A3-like isoform X2 [Tripterygium wilfordii]|uniref:cytochrome P450 87A3-like isoform X2 n=1 Tax=Tripterygium wilfordii TaxID=458696 RepID=UPI0018F82F76|nr:cytochrome P450 87A3-like isoform X2 [Tripterygium wilfordii]
MLGKLPPGSMGLPIIGETIQFFSPHRLYDVPPFMKHRMARYGSLFRTSLVGQKIVVSTDPEINYDLFQQENKSAILHYTESFIAVLGQQSLLNQHGVVHKYLRNLILRLVGPANLKEELLNDINNQTLKHLRSWAMCDIVDIKEAASDMIFEYFSKKMMSYDESKNPRKLKANYDAFMHGLLAFPLNIQGTAFSACLKGRKNVTKVIKDTLKERRSRVSKSTHHDFLDDLLEEIANEDAMMNETIAVELVFMLLFASHETTSTSLTFLVKFISDNPKVLSELTEEHEAILRNRGNSGEYSETITWDEYKSMTFTHMVVNETVRLANIVPGIFRKAVKDIKINEYTIPAGWLIMVVPSVAHLDENNYEDPCVFNPWRWEGKELHLGSKSFMAFGGGSRLCAGADITKLYLAIFLHHFVTKYRWPIIKGGDVVRKPGVVFPDGLHIQVSEKHKS